MALIINPDLQSLIPPLTAEEYAQPEQNLLTDGCRDPLTVWQETNTLLDGHNRLIICERHGLDYHITEISLPGLDAAKSWMIRNQLGRRNLTPEQMSYFRGEQYNLQKQQGKRTDLTSGNFCQKSQDTAAQLASQYKVSARTIRNDAAYAEAVEALAAVLGPEVRQPILAGDLNLTRQDVQALASLVALTPEIVSTMQDALRSADSGPTIQSIARTARCGICHRLLSDPASVSRGIGPVCAGHGNGTQGSSRGASGGGTSMSFPGSSAAPVSVAVSQGLAAHFEQALHSLEALHACLQQVEIPDALDSHTEACIALGKACRQVERLTTKHEAVLQALYGKPTAPRAPSPAARSPTAKRASRPKKAKPQPKYGAVAARIDAVCGGLQSFTCAEIVQQTGLAHKAVWNVLERRVQQHRLSKEELTYHVVNAAGVGSDE